MSDAVQEAELSGAAKAWADYEGPENDKYHPEGRREIAMVRHAFFSGYEAQREEIERLRDNLKLGTDHALDAIEGACSAEDAAAADRALLVEMVDALIWYGAQASNCRKIHSEGERARWALNDDGGERAKAALTRAKARLEKQDG